MAAALLMMNMQGAVMAADKDQTIFRYSDKVPFALIINPNNHATCREVWETLWNKFRLTDIKEEIYSISFINYFKDALPKYQKLPSDFSNETFFLVWYQTENIFPEANAYQLTIDNAQINISETDEASEISTGHPYSVYRIGSFDHMNRLFDGDISDKEKVIQEKVSSFIEDFNPQRYISHKQVVSLNQIRRYQTADTIAYTKIQAKAHGRNSQGDLFLPYRRYDKNGRKRY